MAALGPKRSDTSAGIRGQFWIGLGGRFESDSQADFIGIRRQSRQLRNAKGLGIWRSRGGSTPWALNLVPKRGLAPMLLANGGLKFGM